MSKAAEKYPISISPVGLQSLLINWPKRIDEDILKDIICFGETISKKLAIACEQLPAYHSLLLIFDENIDTVKISDRLLKLYESMEPCAMKRRLWHIPVCYHPDFAPDMQLLSSQKGMSPQKIAELHSSPVYTVYGIGFLPGFMYLGGLDKKLYTPRRKEPRQSVVKGAVGIGGKQTGVYPQESPGGWNIIGNTPVKIFDLSRKKPCPVRIGDKLRFFEISQEEHKLLEIEVSAGVYKLKSEKYHD
ncbi:5-oxoprolinase subunit PxpB [Sinomicrobium sp.]